MNVLLIQLKMGHRRELIYPIGLSCIARAVHMGGHAVKTIDMNTEADPILCITEQLMKCKAQVVGISIRNTDYPEDENVLSQIREITSAMKRIDRKVIIVAGGTGFSIFAEEIMGEIPDIDYGVFLEGEKTIVDLLRNLEIPENVKGIWHKRDGKLLFTGRRLLDDLNNYQSMWNFFPLEKYKFIEERVNLFGIGVESKRGCFFNCAYCLYPFLSGSKVRLRDPVKVVDDIDVLSKEKNIKNFVFTDPVFNVPLDHAVKICKEIIRRKIQINWSAWFDVKNITDEFMRLAVDAGCIEFSFSPDGYTDSTLKKLRKNITKRNINETVSIAKKVDGANVSYNFFLMPPGQTVSGIIMLIFFRIRVKVVLGNKLKACGFSLIHLMPKTNLYEIALKDKLITEHEDMLVKKVIYTPSNLKLISKIFIFLWKFKQKRLRKRKGNNFI